MTVVNNSVYMKLKQDVPNDVLVKCVCHSLQLAMSFSAKECLPRNLEFMVQETYNWLSKLSSRQLAYTDIFK